MTSAHTADELNSAVLGRSGNLFAADVAARAGEIEAVLRDRRVLVIGGAGSIGGATLRALLPFGPAAVHVVDHDENGLAELVRDLRSGPGGLGVAEFRTLPIDFGSPIAHRYLCETAPFDVVLNFAALKHVRSEKDTFSLLQLLQTNVLSAWQLLQWLDDLGAGPRYFAVSTDKAARPTSLMGASKRVMEQVMFASGRRTTSARFANVAFSQGALLESFLRRFERRQPLAAPKDTQRYFISLDEAGSICLLAATVAPPGHFLIPRFSPEDNLVELEEVARRVITQLGFEPAAYLSEDEARAAVDPDMARGRYPLLLTELDTTGEKPYEEFTDDAEVSLEVGLEGLLGVEGESVPREGLDAMLGWLQEVLADPAAPLGKTDIVERLATLVPSLTHRETGRYLDDRM